MLYAVPLRHWKSSGASVFSEASCAQSVGRLQAWPGAAMVLSMAQWLLNGYLVGGLEHFLFFHIGNSNPN